jgi:hypothetical protein
LSVWRSGCWPVRGTAAAGRVDARLAAPRRPGHHRRNRPGHEQVPRRLAAWPHGPGAPAGSPVRQAHRAVQSQERRPVPGCRHRRDRRAGRTQTREGARHRRLARRRGKAKACVATGNTQLKVYHKLLSSPGMRYQDPGPDYYKRQRNVRRQVARHVGKLGALGFEVTLCRIPNPNPAEQVRPSSPDPYRPRKP